MSNSSYEGAPPTPLLYRFECDQVYDFWLIQPKIILILGASLQISCMTAQATEACRLVRRCRGRGSGRALISRWWRGGGRLLSSGGWSHNLFRGLVSKPAAAPTDYGQHDHDRDGTPDHIFVLREFVHNILSCTDCRSGRIHMVVRKLAFKMARQSGELVGSISNRLMGLAELISQSTTTPNLRTIDEGEKTALSAQVVRW